MTTTPTADVDATLRQIAEITAAGCAAVRVNPGNIRKFDDKVREIAHAAQAVNVPIRTVPENRIVEALLDEALSLTGGSRRPTH